MLGFYNYTVILTYIGMLAGFSGITFAINGNAFGALICLMIAGFCDMFDGKVASTMERTKSERAFGVQIDSMSDLICFGVLPALLLFPGLGSGLLRAIPSGFYLLCALIRLSWFNVDEAERQDQETGTRQFFLGLPVTSSAIVFPWLIGAGSLIGFEPDILVTVWAVALVLVGVAFLTPFRMKKPAMLGKIAMMACGLIGFILVLVGKVPEMIR